MTLVLGLVGGFFIGRAFGPGHPVHFLTIPPGPKPVGIHVSGNVVIFDIEVRQDPLRPGHQYAESVPPMMSQLQVADKSGKWTTLAIKDGPTYKNITAMNDKLALAKNKSEVAEVKYPLSEFPTKAGDQWAVYAQARFGTGSTWKQEADGSNGFLTVQ
jgi:hypothetical protein